MSKVIHKVSYDEYYNFDVRYFKNEYPYERYGQAFLNHVSTLSVDHALFNERNPHKARKMVESEYVDFSTMNLS